MELQLDAPAHPTLPATNFEKDTDPALPPRTLESSKAV